MKSKADSHYEASMIWTMKIDAEDRVKKNEKLAIAKKMKNLGANIKLIGEATGLSIKEVDEL